MYIATLLVLLILSNAQNCPLSDSQRCTAFSGLLSASPDVPNSAQDMLYTMNFNQTVSRIPQVCLSICGYEDSNQGIMQIQISSSQITQQSFVIRLVSSAYSRWTKIDMNYLVSTKAEIEIGFISANKPVYDNNGLITIPYVPTLSISNSYKIRPFLIAIDIAAQSGGVLSINHERTELQGRTINFIFSSKSCNIYSISLSLVIFDPNTPGILFVDGSVEQNSLSTSTEVNILSTGGIEELRIHFVGFSSLNAKNSSGLTLAVSFSTSFTLKIDSRAISSIKVTYLVISFISCGSCVGYPYSYNNNCYAQCPAGTQLSSGLCVPISCSNGYELNQNSVCVPKCQSNQYFSGKSCSCNHGYNMINGQCSQCPAGTYFNYVALRCDPTCGSNSQYNQQDGRCYCLNGYVLIGNQCTVCPSGSTYYQQTLSCVPINQCGQNEVFSYNQCVCANGYYRINSYCQTCPLNSVYNPAYSSCQCNLGYTLSNNVCIPSIPTCSSNEILVGYTCQCANGFVRNNQGICITQCQNNEYWTNGQCVCVTGYQKSINGVCYPISCNNNQVYDTILGRCVDRCQSQQNWDNSYQRCIPVCPSGTSYNYSTNTCVTICAQNQYYDGTRCVCSSGCQPTCPPGSTYNPYTQQCTQQCQANAEYVSGRCACKVGYYESNSICYPTNCQNGQVWDQYTATCICSNGGVWNGNSCACRQGTYNYNGQCVVIPCGNNEQLVSGACQCITGYYRINNVCTTCPLGTQWNPIYNQCISITPTCTSGKQYNGTHCVCPSGTQENYQGICTVITHCGANEELNHYGACVCKQGYVKNTYNTCVIQTQCPNGYVFSNGNCIPGSACGTGEEWSGYNCVCKTNYERVSVGVCQPTCPRNSQRDKYGVCQCINGYTKDNRGECVNGGNNGCASPHYWSNGICVCANGYERNTQGQCVEICQNGYTRNTLGYCVPKCSNDQILAEGQCICRTGLYNVNGQCLSCPQYSYQSGNICICSSTNAQLPPGASGCPVPTCDSNSQWNQQQQICQCTSPYQWIYGKCQLLQNCGANSVWNGVECVCNYGYRKVGNVCQPSGQTTHCPDNSDFNGVNCRCRDSFFPINGQCQRCPSGTFYNGQQCQSTQSCLPNWTWNPSLSCCVYSQPQCSQNQEWNGASCQCRQGYFYINSSCQTCPTGTVFDGRQCSKGQSDQRCSGPYQYFNGYVCVCIPGYWQLGNGCVTCPSNYEWNGVCCQSRQGLTRSVSDGDNYGTVPVIIR